MQVILFETVQNLGRVGDTVRVKPGYARNFLIPQGKAAPATEAARAAVEERRAELEKQEAEVRSAAETKAKSMEGLTLEIARKAGEEGKLFGSVGTSDISDAFAAREIEVRRTEIQLPDGAIRQVGEYQIDIRLHSDVEVTINLNVIAEE